MEEQELNQRKIQSLILPYNVSKEEYIINTMRKQLNNKLPAKVKIQK